MKSKAEKIATIIGYENFLRAEAYYYCRSYNLVGYICNFVDFLIFNNLSAAFPWADTEEGWEFWVDLDEKIERELK